MKKLRLLKNIKRKNKIKNKDSKHIDIEKLINIKTLFDNTINLIMKNKYSKNNITNLILNMEDNNGYKLTTKIDVTFKRKNKVYNKNIYIMMNNNMKDNLTSNENTQFFADTTYNCVPPQNKGMKLFIIISYNSKHNKFLLCLLSLIYNENKETFEAIFNFLKYNFGFNPNLFTVDFGKAGYIAIKNVFPNTRIYPCYFHLIRRLIIHIKYLRSKNRVLKRAAKNLLFNMKILLFIDSEEIEDFYGKIKNKYRSSFKKFFNYFDKVYMKSKPFNDKQWNYCILSCYLIILYNNSLKFFKNYNTILIKNINL